MGAGQKLATIDFLVFGLLSCWIYTALRLRKITRQHVGARWVEMGGELEPGEDRDALQARSFGASELPALLATYLFGLAATTVAAWYLGWLWLGYVTSYGTILAIVTLSSLSFYAATVLLVLWATRSLIAHEEGEALLWAYGKESLVKNDFVASDQMQARWESLYQHVALFLVVALPIAFSPVVGTHLFLDGSYADNALWLPVVCFCLAAVFHLWGTMLLVSQFNSHLDFESSQLVAPATEPEAGEKEIQPEPGEVSTHRELAAIMLTDICGYSRAMEADESGMFKRLQDHNHIVRMAVGKHLGREIKTVGDAFLVIFSSALDAVECALEIQRALADYNSSRPEAEKVLVRIGVHIGDVIVTEKDVFGDSVNVAARIEPLAHPGGICVSGEVYNLVRKKLQLTIEHIEGVRLKNIAVAPKIYRLNI
jgi:class 3 adenylate cyclase